MPGLGCLNSELVRYCITGDFGDFGWLALAGINWLMRNAPPGLNSSLSHWPGIKTSWSGLSEFRELLRVTILNHAKNTFTEQI